MEINLFKALKELHLRTEAGVPSSLTCVKLNGEIREYKAVFIRKGYRNNQSKRAKFLISIEDTTTGRVRQYHRRLLIKFNRYKISI